MTKTGIENTTTSSTASTANIIGDAAGAHAAPFRITPEYLGSAEVSQTIFSVVKGAAAAKCGETADDYTCEEVLSTLMDKCHRREVIYDPSRGASLKTLLGTMARNALVDLHRGSGKDPVVSTETVLARDEDGREVKFVDTIPAPDSHCPDAFCFAEDRDYFLAQAFRELERLTAAKAKVQACRLYLTEGLSNGEIAERLHIPASDVAGAKNRYLPVIYKIARRLDREDYEGPRAC